MGNNKFCLCLILWLTLMASSFLWAQKIKNIRVHQDSELRYYKISFDLSSEVDGLFFIKVVPHKNGRELSNLSYLTGAGIEAPISPGKNNLIFWNAALEGYESEGWQFRVIVKPGPQGIVFVGGGEFMMGSSDGHEDEKPIHKITISPFLIGKYEVTQKEWTEVMRHNPSGWKSDNRPVENVSWYDAVEYCNRLSIKEGLTPCYSGKGDNIICNWNSNGYRLPTEAEWEYAAQGGMKSKGYEYSGSYTIKSVSWYSRNAKKRTHEVGTKKPNELGIHDMSGNVFEWCWDRYNKEYYTNSTTNNPKGPDSGLNRVLRGGSSNTPAIKCRVSYRGHNDPGFYGSQNGFRIVRTL